MENTSGTDAALHKAFILHCCRRDYLKLVNSSLAKSPHYEFFPLAVYAAVKVVEWHRWHHWEFLLSQLDALEKLYATSEVGFLFKTARFRAQLIQTFLHVNHLDNSHPKRELNRVDDRENAYNPAWSSNTEDVSTHSGRLDAPTTMDPLAQSKLHKLRHPLNVLMQTIWELIVDGLLESDEAYDIKSHLHSRAPRDILKSSPMREGGSTEQQEHPANSHANAQ